LKRRGNLRGLLWMNHIQGKKARPNAGKGVTGEFPEGESSGN